MTSTSKDEAQVLYKEAVSYLDRMSVKGVIHTNNAARKKRNLSSLKRPIGICLRMQPKLCW